MGWVSSAYRYEISEIGSGETDRVYIWNSKRQGRTVHILKPGINTTYCKMENGNVSRKYLITGDEMPEGRRLCSTCVQIMNRPTREQAVLNPRKFYQTREWHKLRYEAFKQYGQRCMVCGATNKSGARLHVDHVKPIKHYPELAHDINNLQILCALCNSGKGSWDETDWREEESELTPEQESHLRDILQ